MQRPVIILPLFFMLPLFSFGELISYPPQPQILSEHEISLTNRNENTWVNDVFSDNILLNLAYLKGIHAGASVDWNQVRKPFDFEFTLDSGHTFAYHEDVLPAYIGRVARTTNAHFNAQEGFRSSGYLYGDGVCHLASLIYWVAKDAGLEAYIPTNHDFAQIPEIPREYGVSIYSHPLQKSSNTLQNLYITNNKSKSVKFKFEYKDKKIKVLVEQN